MTNEEAIAVIENEIQIDVRLCTDKQLERFQIALYMAISALRAEPTVEPLTMEKLRETDGKPVWVVPQKSEHDYCGWCVVSVSDRGDKYSCAEIPGVEYWSWNFEDYGKSWIAYAYPLAHIDWGAWEPCESCISCENCKNNGDYDPYEGSYGECGQCYGFSNFEPSNFCRECGRPLTEEAQGELEKRLRG